MSYSNRNYSQRGRFNSPGQFVPGGKLQGLRQTRSTAAAAFNNSANMQQQQHQEEEEDMWPVPPSLPPVAPQQPQQQQQQQQGEEEDMWPVPPPLPPVAPQEPLKMEEDAGESADSQSAAAGRPIWMKTKLAGVKKLSNRERRKRQNENLRKLITPKNALTVLNEILPGEAVAGQFKVEQEQMKVEPFFSKNNANHSFYADLTIEGRNYRGYGENKVRARNSAAEQAIRDLIIKRMTKYLGGAVSGADGGESVEGGADEQEENEALPMIQLTSFALYKLFSEWESEGHKVPQLRQLGIPGEPADEAAALHPKAPKPPKKPRELPPNAGSMHPCMLLTYMRQNLEYREIAVEGDKPQNILFTIGIEVDGRAFVGKASNKKEARRLAAKAACEAVFGVNFDGPPPQPAQP